MEPAIRAVYEQLREQYPGRSLYFPFQLSESRPLRAFQGYLTKFPSGLVAAIPQLADVGAVAAQTRPTAEEPAPAADREELGTEYRSANPNARTAKREPFSIDPDLVDRALRGHAETQEALAAAVRAADLTPRSPVPGEPVFDIAWDDGDDIVVAEVKSLTKRNEERQLRLALGQVIRYAHLLSVKGSSVRKVIAVEREPSDPSWAELCAQSGVTLVWPATFGVLFAASVAA